MSDFFEMNQVKVDEDGWIHEEIVPKVISSLSEAQEHYVVYNPRTGNRLWLHEGQWLWRDPVSHALYGANVWLPALGEMLEGDYFIVLGTTDSEGEE